MEQQIHQNGKHNGFATFCFPQKNSNQLHNGPKLSCSPCQWLHRKSAVCQTVAYYKLNYLWEVRHNSCPSKIPSAPTCVTNSHLLHFYEPPSCKLPNSCETTALGNGNSQARVFKWSSVNRRHNMSVYIPQKTTDYMWAGRDRSVHHRQTINSQAQQHWYTKWPGHVSNVKTSYPPSVIDTKLNLAPVLHNIHFCTKAALL